MLTPRVGHLLTVIYIHVQFGDNEDKMYWFHNRIVISLMRLQYNDCCFLLFYGYYLSRHYLICPFECGSFLVYFGEGNRVECFIFEQFQSHEKKLLLTNLRIQLCDVVLMINERIL